MWEPWQIESLLYAVHNIARGVGSIAFILGLMLFFKRMSR